MSSTYLSKHGRTLIDAIFHERDQELLRSFRERLERVDRRQQLAEMCGIDDEDLLDRMIDLDMRPETVAAISFVPLVLVAWADGVIQPEERVVIIQEAEAALLGGGPYPVLEHWLTNKPGPEMLQAWKIYITALCQQLNGDEVAELKEDLLGRVKTVAEAVGGILGLGSKISAQEKAVMETLEQAFVDKTPND